MTEIQPPVENGHSTYPSFPGGVYETHIPNSYEWEG